MKRFINVAVLLALTSVSSQSTFEAVSDDFTIDNRFSQFQVAAPTGDKADPPASCCTVPTDGSTKFSCDP